MHTCGRAVSGRVGCRRAGSSVVGKSGTHQRTHTRTNRGQKGPIPKRPVPKRSIPERPNSKKAHTRKAKYRKSPYQKDPIAKMPTPERPIKKVIILHVYTKLSYNRQNADAILFILSVGSFSFSPCYEPYSFVHVIQTIYIYSI